MKANPDKDMTAIQIKIGMIKLGYKIDDYPKKIKDNKSQLYIRHHHHITIHHHNSLVIPSTSDLRVEAQLTCKEQWKYIRSKHSLRSEMNPKYISTEMKIDPPPA